MIIYPYKIKLFFDKIEGNPIDMFKWLNNTIGEEHWAETRGSSSSTSKSLQNPHGIDFITIYFKNKNDETLFQLTWGGDILS